MQAQPAPWPHIPWVIQTVWRSAPREASLNLVAGLGNGLGPAMILMLLQRLTDQVAQPTGDGWITPLLWLAVVLLLAEGAGALWPVTNVYLLEKTERAINRLILQKGATLTLAQFDAPPTHDMIQRAATGHGGRVARLWGLAGLVGSDLLRVGTALLLLAGASPLLALLGLMVAIPVGWVGLRGARRLWETDRGQTPLRRRADYFAGLVLEREPAAELRAYQLISHLTDRWRASFRLLRSYQLQARWHNTREGWLADLAAAGLFAGALLWIALRASRQEIGAGQIVMLIGAVQMLQSNAAYAASHLGQLWEFGLPLTDLHRFLNLPVPGRPTACGAPFPSPLTGPICLEDVSFTYPGQTEPVLQHLTFSIHPGETIALVGGNGAGKSTLIKLLLGLYRPTSGRITIGGVDLAAIDPHALAQNISCILQEFGRYHLTVRENVTLGSPGATQEEVEAACAAAGAAPLVDGLPHRYETVLGRSFTGGIELSGGQWQRIALARAFLREAQILVLDEPTAALDVRAELALYTRFAERAAGRTTILVSHRLGAARLADRIIVLAGGRIAESGSHDLLVQQNGLYADLFRAQAGWYEEVQVS